VGLKVGPLETKGGRRMMLGRYKRIEERRKMQTNESEDRRSRELV
jgi:hypothetical protein